VKRRSTTNLRVFGSDARNGLRERDSSFGAQNNTQSSGKNWSETTAKIDDAELIISFRKSEGK